MKKFFMNMGYKLRKFMTGRYGPDRLWRALLVFYLIGIIIANILYRFSKPAYYVMFIISSAVFIFAIYRVFSKNIEKRRQENQQWLNFIYGIKRKFRFEKDKLSQRKTHKFVKCSQCKKVLRIPKNKGKIKVNCPHCGNTFIVKTGKRQKAKSN